MGSCSIRRSAHWVSRWWAGMACRFVSLPQHWSCGSFYHARLPHSCWGFERKPSCLQSKLCSLSHLSSPIFLKDLETFTSLLIYLYFDFMQMDALPVCTFVYYICAGPVEARFHFCRLSSGLLLSTGTHTHVYICVWMCIHTMNKCLKKERKKMCQPRKESRVTRTPSFLCSISDISDSIFNKHIAYYWEGDRGMLPWVGLDTSGSHWA